MLTRAGVAVKKVPHPAAWLASARPLYSQRSGGSVPISRRPD